MVRSMGVTGFKSAGLTALSEKYLDGGWTGFAAAGFGEGIAGAYSSVFLSGRCQTFLLSRLDRSHLLRYLLGINTSFTPKNSAKTMKKALIIPVLFAAATCANAAIFQYQATLDGAHEPSGDTGSLGTGLALVNYDSTAHMLYVSEYYVGTANVTAGHIHAASASPFSGTAGVAVGFTGFPTGSGSGTYNASFDLSLTSTYNAGFLGSQTASQAEASLISAFNAGKAYVNVHSVAFGGGEIAGFLTPVPEPAETCVVGAGLLGAFALARRARSTKSK